MNQAITLLAPLRRSFEALRVPSDPAARARAAHALLADDEARLVPRAIVRLVCGPLRCVAARVKLRTPTYTVVLASSGRERMLPTRVEASAGESTLILEASSSLDELASYSPVDASSTNLNGAVVQALQGSASAQKAFRDRNRGGAFTAGHVVVFTDGTDTAGRVTFDAAMEAIQQSPDDVIAIGLRGNDYDPSSLRALVGDYQVVDADDDTVLNREFQYVAARIAGQTRRSYLLGYCSPKRSGTHSVYVGIKQAETRVWG